MRQRTYDEVFLDKNALSLAQDFAQKLFDDARKLHLANISLTDDAPLIDQNDLASDEIINYTDDFASVYITELQQEILNWFAEPKPLIMGDKQSLIARLNNHLKRISSDVPPMIQTVLLYPEDPQAMIDKERIDLILDLADKIQETQAELNELE